MHSECPRQRQGMTSHVCMMGRKIQDAPSQPWTLACTCRVPRAAQLVLRQNPNPIMRPHCRTWRFSMSSASSTPPLLLNRVHASLPYAAASMSSTSARAGARPPSSCVDCNPAPAASPTGCWLIRVGETEPLRPVRAALHQGRHASMRVCFSPAPADPPSTGDVGLWTVCSLLCSMASIIHRITEDCSPAPAVARPHRPLQQCACCSATRPAPSATEGTLPYPSLEPLHPALAALQQGQASSAP